MTTIILQTLGGVLVTICLGLVAWCLKQVVGLKERVAKNEGRDDARQEEIDRRFTEQKEETNRLRHESIELTRQLAKDVKGLDDKLSQMQADIAALKVTKHGR